MPTPIKHSSKQTKHLTKEEKARREAAENELGSGKEVRLYPPSWLSPKAAWIFEKTAKQMLEYQILERVDTELLAMYADATARYHAGVEKLEEATSVEVVKTVQAWSRIALAYAEKLGISQSARMRLARKKAEAEVPDEMASLISEVTDFVNGDGDARR